MKILVTGANGYIGQGVVRHLLDKGAEVVAADFKADFIDSRAESVSCDLFGVRDPYDYFGKPDALLHLAWRDGFKHYSDAHIGDFQKHCDFIKSFAESGISRIAVIGSMHEIGFYEGCVKEDTPCNPTTPYGICKNALRQYTQSLCKANDKVFQWLRGYYIVGNTSRGNSIFSKITEASDQGKKVFPFTFGQNQFDFIDYEDFCEQVACAASQEEITGIINICSGKPEKLADRVERFIADNGYDIDLDYGVFPERANESKALWGDNTKISRIMADER